MNSKNTWLWLIIAAALFGFIFLFERYAPHPDNGPKPLLPGLNPASVTAIQIRPAGQLEIRVERTNASWQLTEPLVYPAQNTNVDNLLGALQRLTIAHPISEQELTSNPRANEAYGIEPPELSLVLQQGDSSIRIHFGHRTAPGDQVFVQVVGIGGIAVVDADVLKLFPHAADDWRDTALADFTRFTFDRIAATNTTRSQSVELQRDLTNKLWRMTLPMPTRADNAKVQEALQRLQNSRVQQFIPNDPKADLESYGLQTPALSIAFARSTNTLLLLDFGKSPTNNSSVVYARRRDQNSIVTISTNTLESWLVSYEIFRDRHLTTLPGPLDSIEVHAQDEFSLQWQTNNMWHVTPQNFLADTALVAELVENLGGLQVADFEKDSVTPQELPLYGLGPPARKYILNWAAEGSKTSAPVELDFGTNSENKVFARRVPEYSVAAIAPGDFEKLFSASWQFRDRHIWNFSASDITQITIQQNGATRQILREGTNSWKLAPGSQGIINVAAIEDTVSHLGRLNAAAWAARGLPDRERFGFKPNGQKIYIELKSHEKLELEFGGEAPTGCQYAVVMLDNEPWVFEFPIVLYPAVQFCLAIPTAP